MKKVIGILLVFALLLTGCEAVQTSEAKYVPVNMTNASSENNTNIVGGGKSRKVVALQGAMFIDDNVNRWIKNNPDKNIVSLNVIPLGDGHGQVMVIIVYEEE